ncbi:hypothetical protein, partial [Streptococcus salivarius]|uniref:hypothetical protein n=1 Tax=Streptococcus salivarius TaxID=1304 RepID=UPI00321ABFF3
CNINTLKGTKNQNEKTFYFYMYQDKKKRLLRSLFKGVFNPFFPPLFLSSITPKRFTLFLLLEVRPSAPLGEAR